MNKRKSNNQWLRNNDNLRNRPIARRRIGFEVDNVLIENNHELLPSLKKIEKEELPLLSIKL
jgi:hypothetical protein